MVRSETVKSCLSEKKKKKGFSVNSLLYTSCAVFCNFSRCMLKHTKRQVRYYKSQLYNAFVIFDVCNRSFTLCVIPFIKLGFNTSLLYYYYYHHHYHYHHHHHHHYYSRKYHEISYPDLRGENVQNSRITR